jgi:hypothetical protein
MHRFSSKREKHGSHHSLRHRDHHHEDSKDKVIMPSSLSGLSLRISCRSLVPPSFGSWSRGSSPRSSEEASVIIGIPGTEEDYFKAMSRGSGANSAGSLSPQHAPPTPPTAHYNALFAADDSQPQARDEDKKVVRPRL